ncbi:MAG: pyridoxal-phosphate dependent enzyme, partial [Gordonia sp. (in: high G+C Gram-positive bacteria)]
MTDIAEDAGQTPARFPQASDGVTDRSPLGPDDLGHWGDFGGRHVPEALMAVIEEVTATYEKLRADDEFITELDDLQRHYTGRPSPLYEATRLSEYAGGARIFLKREDLNHTGSHKINNVLGQALLAQRMGKTRVIAETGAGQHGVATATACALLGLECLIYMGRVDTERQALNVARMRLL